MTAVGSFGTSIYGALIIPEDPRGVQDSVHIEFTDGQQWQDTSTITAFPVGSGVVNDHVIDENGTLSISGRIPERPWNFLGATLAPNRAVQVYERLRSIKKQHRLVTIRTSLQTFRGYVIRSIRVTRDKDSRDSIPVAIECEEFRQAYVTIVDAVEDADARAVGATGTVDKGRSDPSTNAPRGPVTPLRAVSLAP